MAVHIVIVSPQEAPAVLVVYMVVGARQALTLAHLKAVVHKEQFASSIRVTHDHFHQLVQGIYK